MDLAHEKVVALEPGHALAILVQEATTRAPLADLDLLFDGRPAGRTDLDGLFVHRGPRVPREITLRDSSGEREVLADDWTGPIPRRARSRVWRVLAL